MKCYKQIPKVNSNFCPACDIECNTYHPTKVLFYNLKDNKTTVRYVNLLCCSKCDIRFANEAIFKEFYSKRNYFRPRFFATDKMNTSLELFKKIRSSPIDRDQLVTAYYNESKSDKTKQSKIKGMEVVSVRQVNFKASIKDIYLTNSDKKCTFCRNEINSYVNVIPINSSQVVKIKGMYCRNCQKFFYTDMKRIEKILKDNDYAKDYIVHSECSVESKMLETYSYLYSDFCYIYLKDEDNDSTEKITIVSDKKYVDEASNIYYYADVVARTLLADIIHLNKENIILNNKNYRVTTIENSYFASNKSYIIQKLNIRENGGFYSAAGNNEIVDVLLYSPFTKRYELIKATYDQRENYYYVDISKLKRFVEKFGNPGIPIKFITYKNSDGSYEMNEESILHMFGYTVSKLDKLSDGKRQGIIAFILDMELMSAKEIMNLLNHLIISRKDIKYNIAKMKWERDVEFTENYKVNPERFIIAD